jgi:hypothetical protein
MRFISTRRTAAAIAAAVCMAVPATAHADSDAAQLEGARTQTQSKAESTFPPADFRGGDNPADHPGMSRAPKYEPPTTVEVVRPERTIVRDVDATLPIALAATALLLVLAMLVVALMRASSMPWPRRSS